jgi:hypothetical protein
VEQRAALSERYGASNAFSFARVTSGQLSRRASPKALALMILCSKSASMEARWGITPVWWLIEKAVNALQSERRLRVHEGLYSQVTRAHGLRLEVVGEF